MNHLNLSKIDLHCHLDVSIRRLLHRTGMSFILLIRKTNSKFG